MKRLSIILFIGAGIVAWHSCVFAENRKQWDKWQEHQKEKTHITSVPDNTQGKITEATPKSRFCSSDQEVELLELLKELKDPSLSKRKHSGKSEVRRKSSIARKLRKFDDCRAEDALKELIRKNECEDLGEGEALCVKWAASTSLQEITSKKDLKKLTPDTPLPDLLMIFKKYGPHPHENEFASHKVMEFLIEQAAVNPRVYIPLMVEYFTTCHEIVEVIRQYPQETNSGLKRCFFSTEPTVVWAGINLARMLGKPELLATVYEVAFEEKGPLDYSRQDEIEEIRTAAINFFRMHEADAVQYYRGVLYGVFDKGKESVISGIRDLANPELLTLLKEFSFWLQDHPEQANALLITRLQKKIARMEEVQR